MRFADGAAIPRSTIYSLLFHVPYVDLSVYLFVTFDLICEQNSYFSEEDEHCIVYDDAAIDRLLDRSQQGLEEKAIEMNDYLTSFKVAHYEKKGVMEEDEEESDEEDENREVSLYSSPSGGGSSVFKLLTITFVAFHLFFALLFTGHQARTRSS